MTDEFERTVLRYKQYAQQILIDGEAFYEADPVFMRDAFGDILFRMQANILTDSLPPERYREFYAVVNDIPASVWQAWKKFHAPAWFTARYPVRYISDPDGRHQIATCEFDLERSRIYPKAKPMPRSFGDAVFVHTITEPRWWTE
jgi:hypothetical protein